MIHERAQHRRVFFEAWKKHKSNQPLDALEQQIIQLIEMHPDFISIIENPEQAVSIDFQSDANPFLHLGLHLGLIEQLTTNRPQGVREIYQQLCSKRDPHQVEHQMMSVMGEILWEAQEYGLPPDEAEYLKVLRTLL